MIVVNNPYIIIILGVCSITGRNLLVWCNQGGEESGGCGGEGVCGSDCGAVVVLEGMCVCDGGAVVAVERVCVAGMVVVKRVCAAVMVVWLWWRVCGAVMVAHLFQWRGHVQLQFKQK